ncbi:cytochrome P450 [Daedaleopsis nitida]|nr:cytochrome P450 [Daedaleopsis nitida]
MSTHTLLLTLGALVLVLGLAYWQVFYRTSRRYPPGPPVNPVTGNLLYLPSKEPWKVLAGYKEQYGDLVFFHGFGTRVLVLNSMNAINDLLEKRSRIYSDRPVYTVACELIGLGNGIPLLPYNEQLRVQRKLVHSALSPVLVKNYHAVQEDLAALLCQQLIEDPRDFMDHVRLATGRHILSVTYGLSANAADDEYITHAEATLRMVSEVLVPGVFLCDLFPWMKHLPSFLPFQKVAKKGKEMVDILVSRPFEHVKDEMESIHGSAPPSLTRDLLSAAGSDELLHHHIKWSTGSLFGAGGETIYGTVLTFIMAMALYTNKQQLAQDEIDRVVGKDRLPSIHDRPHLPYVDAVIKETMRYHPVVPLSLPRCTAQDDMYDGYVIPKGTIVLPNVWAIAHETRGPYNPFEFAPERFLDTISEGDLPIDPMVYNFGFSRRACPGRHLAENSLFILLATLLCTFDISPPGEGEMSAEFSNGAVSYPLPFECSIVPRSSSKISLIAARAAQTTTV